jgi:hypothetical protein
MVTQFAKALLVGTALLLLNGVSTSFSGFPIQFLDLSSSFT